MFRLLIKRESPRQTGTQCVMDEACLLGLRSDMRKDISDMNIIAQDFTALFEKENRERIIAWKWNGKPETLENKIAEYTVPISIKHDYEKDIEVWIEKK